MSFRRIKTWLMAAACTGLVGLVAGDAHAFCGKLFSKRDACADPCAQPCPPANACDPCGKSGRGLGGGLRDLFSRGGRGAGDCCPNPCAPMSGAVVAPVHTTQKVKVTEWVPTWVEETVTVMKPVKKMETYTAHRWECVPETVTCQVMVNKMVTETVNENRCVTERVPVTKTVTVHERVPVTKTVTVMERRPVQKTVTVNEVCWKNVMVTEMRSKTVTHKVQVPYCETRGPSLVDRLKAKCDPCYTPCPRTVSGCRTEKCKETVCEPVTVCKRVAECVPVTKTICTYECVPVTKQVCTYECVPVQKQVTCYQCVTKQVCVPVTRTRCVPTCETVTKTVNVRKCVAYQATREVTVCEPVQEKVKVCKMVAQVVEREVACAAPCGGCPTDCCPSSRGGLFDRLRGLFGGRDRGCGGKKAKRGNDCCGAPARGAAAGCCR